LTDENGNGPKLSLYETGIVYIIRPVCSIKSRRRDENQRINSIVGPHGPTADGKPGLFGHHGHPGAGRAAASSSSSWWWNRRNLSTQAGGLQTFTDENNNLQVDLPADWTYEHVVSDDGLEYWDTFTSPDEQALVESFVYNDKDGYAAR
jgi:hypothetical protein